AVFHAYLHWASTPQRLASHSSKVVPQVMPVVSRWEGDTRLSGLLVAESEPDHDGSPGLVDRDPGLSCRVFGAFVQSAALQAGQILRGRRVLRGRVVRRGVVRCRTPGKSTTQSSTMSPFSVFGRPATLPPYPSGPSPFRVFT